MKTAVLSNPASTLNRRAPGRASAILAGHPEVQHATLDRFDDLDGLLDDFARRGIELLVVDGGDGTVQAVLTGLLVRRPFAELPVVAILPRGNTNMTADDVGLRGPPERALRRLLAGLAGLAGPAGLAGLAAGGLPGRLEVRHVLRVDRPDGPAVCGMFFGTAAVCRGIEICRERVHSRGFRASAANALTIAGLFLHILFRRRDSDFYRGDRISISLDDGAAEARSWFLLYASTLERLILGSRPWWGDGAGPMRLAAVPFPPKGFLRHAPALFTGRHRGPPPPGFLGARPDHAVLDMACDWTMDGEIYPAVAGQPLRLSAAGPVRFLVM